ncbi:MAG: NAD(P)-binding domain-containing protein [Bacillota bacterium]
MKVAIIGAGRMGSLLANRLPGNVRKVIISRRRASAVELADEVGGIAADTLSAVRGCAVVFLAVPGPVLPNLLPDLAPHLEPEALVVNMATEVDTGDLAAQFPDLRLVAAKVIGHAREMVQGSPGIVVLDRVTPREEEVLANLLGGLGPVIRDREAKVMLANTAVAEEMVRAEQNLRRRLEDLGLEPDLIRIAIRTTAPGVLRSLSAGDAGPFVQDVIRRLRGG